MYWEVLGWWLLPPNLEGGTCTIGSHWKTPCCSNTSGQHKWGGKSFLWKWANVHLSKKGGEHWSRGDCHLILGAGWGLLDPRLTPQTPRKGEIFFFFSSGKLLLPFINLPWVKLSSYRFITVLLAFRQIWYCGVVVCWLSRRSKTSIFERYFHWFYICLIGFFTLVL